MAFGVLRALRELKIKLENIGLAGFDDISFASEPVFHLQLFIYQLKS